MPGNRRWVALVVSALTVEACGGRTSILAADYETASDDGDTGMGGSAGSGGSGGDSGLVTGAGGTTLGAGGAPLGGTGANGGLGGSSTGGGAVGGGVPAGSGGAGATPGAGGSKAGQGGSSSSGSAGVPATGGTGGSPELLAACETACQRQPPACVGSQSTSCDFACQPISKQFPGCQQEITDYFDCLSKALDPDAICKLASNGDCYGDHCTTQATNLCADFLQRFSSCEAGCSSTVDPNNGAIDGGCSIERSCPGHDYYSTCHANGTGTDYDCSCTIDGKLVEEFTLSFEAHDVCVDADAQCASIIP